MAVPQHLEEFRAIGIGPEVGRVIGEQEALDDMLVGVAVVAVGTARPVSLESIARSTPLTIRVRLARP